MLKKMSEQDLTEHLERRKFEITNLKKLPKLDKFYLSFLSKYESLEITPDIEIFGYEKVIKENGYLEANYPDISQTLWVIGGTGQGDDWFMDKESNNILFYDHNQGEYFSNRKFLNFNISFLEFLQMAFLYQELELLLDKREEVSKDEIKTFKEAINSIKSNLYELYPFKYF